MTFLILKPCSQRSMHCKHQQRPNPILVVYLDIGEKISTPLISALNEAAYCLLKQSDARRNKNSNSLCLSDQQPTHGHQWLGRWGNPVYPRRCIRGRPSRMVPLNMTPRGKLPQRAWGRCSHETGGTSMGLSLKED